MESPRRPFRRPGPRRDYRPQQQHRHAPIPEGFSLYYMAIMCPPEVDAEIAAMKDHMHKRYGCKAARKSPAHLTIVPPFRAETEMQEALKSFADTFSIGILPFTVRLKDYGQFDDRVLFVNVEGPNADLQSLESTCMAEFATSFPGIIFGRKPEFNPHVTIATRDIPEGRIGEARTYFEANHPIDLSFEVRRIDLLRMDKGWWNVV